MAQLNVLEQIVAGGISLASATEEQKALLAGLSEAEAQVLVSVKARLDAAGADVEAHREGNGGVFSDDIQDFLVTSGSA